MESERRVRKLFVSKDHRQPGHSAIRPSNQIMRAFGVASPSEVMARVIATPGPLREVGRKLELEAPVTASLEPYTAPPYTPSRRGDSKPPRRRAPRGRRRSGSFDKPTRFARG